MTSLARLQRNHGCRAFWPGWEPPFILPMTNAARAPLTAPAHAIQISLLTLTAILPPFGACGEPLSSLRKACHEREIAN